MTEDDFFGVSEQGLGHITPNLEWFSVMGPYVIPYSKRYLKLPALVSDSQTL